MSAYKGVLHHKAKITEEQVRSIRRRYALGGVSQMALAKEHGLNQKTVWEIINYRIWKSV